MRLIIPDPDRHGRALRSPSRRMGLSRRGGCSMSRGGTPLPNERRTSERMVIMTTNTGRAPREARFSSGPCAKRPGWTPAILKDAPLGRSHRAKAGKAKLKLAIDLTREFLRFRPITGSASSRVRYRRGRNGALVLARPARRRRVRLGNLRRGLGHRYRRAIEARGCPRAQAAYGEMPDLARSISTMTSSSPGTARHRACAFPTPIGSRPTARA